MSDRSLSADTFWISQGEGYGGTPYTVGEVLHNPRTSDAVTTPYVIVLHAESEYVRDDGYSFGVGDESGYLYRARVRRATDAESAALREADARAAAKRQTKVEVAAIAQCIRADGTRPQDVPMPAGERVFDTQNIHGSGSVFVLATDGAWYLDRRMMDGDDWGRNNVAGVYCGWFLADLAGATRLRALALEDGADGTL